LLSIVPNEGPVAGNVARDVQAFADPSSAGRQTSAADQPGRPTVHPTPRRGWVMLRFDEGRAMTIGGATAPSQAKLRNSWDAQAVEVPTSAAGRTDGGGLRWRSLHDSHGY